MVGADERDGVSSHQLASERERLVGLRIRRAEVAEALGEQVVLRPVPVHVVEVRVRIAVHVRRHREPEELVLELVGNRVAEHQQVGLAVEDVEDVLQVREVGVLPHQALLGVRVLVDDQRLERCEVTCDRGREVVRQRLLEGRGAGWPERVVGGVHPCERGEVDPELGQVRRDLDCLRVKTRRLPGTGSGQRHLDVRPIAGGQVRGRCGAVLARRRIREQDAVVVGRRVVGGVVDVEVVEAVDVVRGGKRRVGELDLLLPRRAV